MKILESSAHEDELSPAALPSPHGAVNGTAASTDLSRVDDTATITQTPPPSDATSNGVPDLPDLPDLSEFKTPRFTLPIIDWASKSAEKMAVILSLFVCLLLLPYVLNFETRNDRTRVLWNILPLRSTLERWEYSLYDERFAARGAILPKSRDKIALIQIDQRSLTVLGAWPWPREWHAELIKRLKKVGAKVIALDIDFSDKNNGPNKPLSKSDQALIAASKAANNVVLPSLIEVSEAGHLKQLTGKNTAGEAEADLLTSPFSELDETTPDLGVAYIPRDPDEGARRYVWRTIRSDENVGGYAALIAASFQGLLDGNKNERYNHFLTTATWPDLSGQEHHVPLAQAHQEHAENKTETFLTNFWGPPSVPDMPSTFAAYSYSDILRGNSGEYTDAKLHEKFNGRIVLVGGTAVIFHDVHPMPYIPAVNAFNGAASAVEMPGVELHATVTAMLLDGTYIRAASLPITLLSLLGLTLTASLLIALLRGWISNVARKAQAAWRQRNAPGSIHAIVWLGLYLSLGALPVFLFWQAAIWLFIHQHLWVIAVYPLTGALLSAGMMLMLLFAAESAERRKAMTQFSRFVSPDVLDEILAHPEEDWPRPRRVHATVLFTDLEGFTTYSENHEPEQVIECLNAYMDRMVPLVQSYGGTIDKYIGDAIMVYFGAPVPRYDHAEQALLCAIAMQEECARFREDTGVPFYMRIGVHTGDVIVGSMGSESRLDYTVIGDTVNLASRLEGKNKEFGSWIMCSAATYEAAPHVVCVESASAQVKGKLKAVEVYVVRGLLGAEPVDSRWGKQLTEEQKQHELREAYHKRLAEAEAALEEARQLPAPLRALPQPEAAGAVAAALAEREPVEAGH